MLFPVIRNADRRCRYAMSIAARITSFDTLNTSLDFADAFQIVIDLVLVGSADLRLYARNLVGQQIENAAIGSTSIGAFFLGCAVTKQLIEHVARIANHRQRLVRLSPADRVGINARI